VSYLGRTSSRLPRWSRVDTFALFAVTLAGGLLRLKGLRAPGGMIFDEFYANDACWYLYSSASKCGFRGEITAVHPPLGKWLIAAGIRIFGYDPTGWRIASVIVGTLTVAAVYLLARRLLNSTLGAIVTSGLLALDFLHFVMSRMAMLDVFVTFFGVAAFLFLILDRDRLLEGRFGSAGRWRAVRDRPWRVAAGAAAGLGAATKWSGWFVLAAIICLTVAWELRSRRVQGRPGPLVSVIRQEGPSIALGLLLLPLVVYLVTFAGRIDGSLLAWPWAPQSWLRAFVDRQAAMARFHLPLGGNNPYASPAWSWLLLKRPVVFYLLQTPPDQVREVLATGSPLVWWASIPALVLVAVNMLRRNARVSAEGAILAGFAFAYLPWLGFGLERSQLFMFYLLPAVPFMCLALGYVATMISRSMRGRAVLGIFALGAIVLFAFYYPLLADRPLPPSSWKDRILFRDCSRPITAPLAVSGRSAPGTTKTNASRGIGPIAQPQAGWCWL
jgi:dolichyl-phosphate-mannose-protein mannosyltransferase